MGLKSKRDFNFSTKKFVEYIKNESEKPFIDLFNIKYSRLGTCQETSIFEDQVDKIDFIIRLTTNDEIRCNIKDVTARYTDVLWLNKNIKKNFTIKPTDLSSTKLDAFVFPKYVLNETKDRYIKSTEYYILSKQAMQDIIEDYQITGVKYNKNDKYYIINLSDIEKFSLVLNDATDVRTIKKYFN